jgi:hypothetical protein
MSNFLSLPTRNSKGIQALFFKKKLAEHWAGLAGFLRIWGWL